MSIKKLHSSVSKRKMFIHFLIYIFLCSFLSGMRVRSSRVLTLINSFFYFFERFSNVNSAFGRQVDPAKIFINLYGNSKHISVKFVFMNT